MDRTVGLTYNGGPLDDDGPSFPVSAGQGMGFGHNTRLRESKKNRSPKQIIKEAEGVLNPARTKAKKKKMGPKPENLRASNSKKRGPFGESYKAGPGAKGKGVRVAESNRGQRMYENLVRKFVNMGKKKHVAEAKARRHVESILGRSA